MLLCYINGQFVSQESAKLPVTDLIIQRGVGVFEVIATYNSRPLLLTPHLERLKASADSAKIKFNLDLNNLKNIIREGIKRAGGEVRVKVYLTGGDSFDELTGEFINPRLFILFEQLEVPSQEQYEKGVTLEPVAYGRKDPTVKSVDYRSSYMISQPDAYEVLYCPDGEITETGHSSFFLVVNNKLVTAPLSRVLKGTTRQAILEIAKREGIIIEERCPLWSELAEAGEAFITGSSKKVVPVVKVGNIKIGDGKPGALTRRIYDLYIKHIENWLE
ncbi:MAG: aminotransferase class IV family protein [Synergistaceae bacterium]|nr:aminotransferase class IV family protein [Synergistaceae bacterium]MBQ4419526.1 aminotransferase class IV family protein [Synergistaceae bacterium]MBQ7570325.1 aminotransferase class IV family protein [Synergistaceae bacterium]MBQ9897349.1 aminotransferase class IV family protein [Synergistaceae bacterium]MBR0221376.1 aminotransferase class IV family protein [Synergistaceae bacterium]